jgi:hypothetical protein
MRLLSRVPLRVAMPKSMSFTVPSRVIMMLLGLTSRWTMAAFSNTYCSARQTRLTMKTDELDVGQPPQLAVPLQVLDEAPAVDVLQDDAQLAGHALEVEDARRCSRGRDTRNAAPRPRRAGRGPGPARRAAS